MRDGVELAQDHAILDALGPQGDDFLVFRNRLIQQNAGRRNRGWGILPLAQLAQIDAPQQPVRVNVAGIALEQFARHALRIACTAKVEIKLGQAVVQLRRSRIGVQRQLVLLDCLGRQFRVVPGRGLFFGNAGQPQVIVSQSAIRRRGRFSHLSRCGRGCRRTLGRSKLDRADGWRLDRMGLRRNAGSGTFKPALTTSLGASKPGRRKKDKCGGNNQPEEQQTGFSCHHPGIPWRAETDSRQPVGAALPTVQTILTAIGLER